MKATKVFFLLLFSIASLPLFAQTSTKASPLVGTWTEKTDSIQEIKLISPTHVFFFVRSLVNDSAFAAGAGTYSLSGNKYTENLEYATFDIKSIKEATYDYTANSNTLKTQGNLVLTSGRQIPLKHTFTRIQDARQNAGKHVGTWNQLSAKFNTGDGPVSHTNATHIRYQIMTPTHWMRINLANGVFENVFGGTYTLEGNKMIAKIDFASIPIVGSTAELTQRMDGTKMIWTGIAKDAQGKQFIEFEDVYERVDAKQ